MIADKIRPSYNPTAKPTSITLKGGKGEWLAFFVPIRTSGETFNSFVPSVQSTLTKGGDTIADANWKFYMVQYVDTGTHDTYGQGGARLGRWPDACVPYKDRWYDETRNSSEMGWNKTVADGDTQPFLFEIYIPSTAVAGTYTGKVRLTGQGASALTQDIDITLVVWNLSLPLQWSYGSTFAIQDKPEIDSVFGSSNWGRALDMFTKSAVDHGLWLYGGQYYMGPSIDSGTGAASFTDGKFNDASYGYKRWLDGTVSDSPYSPRPYMGYRPKAFETRSNSGHVWGLTGNDAARVKRYFDDWDSFISSNGYGSYTYFVGKNLDEAPAPTGCTTEDSYNDNAMAGGKRTYIYPGETIGIDTGVNPWAGCCDATSLKTYHQWWIVSEMMGFIRPAGGGARPVNSPRANFDTRINIYGDKVWVYTANTQSMDYNTYGQDDAHTMPSWYIDTVQGGGEIAASPLSM